MDRRFPKTGIFTLCPRALPSRHVCQGVCFDPVRQGVKVPSPDTFDFNWLGSSPLRRTSSAYPSTFQPFSARNCRRGNYLLGKPPEVLCFLCFLWRYFFLLLSRFFIFSLFRVFPATSTSTILVYVLGFFPFRIHKNSCFTFFFPPFFSFFSFVFSLQVTREDNARQQLVV